MDQKTATQTPKESWRISEWFKDLSEAELASLKRFHEEILKANASLGLISAKTIPFADAIHFADCINAARLINKNSSPQKIFDIGNGSGFPGVIIAILNPNTQVTIIDRDQKKLDFLKGIGTMLGLKNLAVLNQGIETLPDGSLNCAVSRGLPISKAILALRKPFKKGGVYYMLKGEEWATEVSQIPSQLCTFWTPELVGDYKLPIGEVKFAVVRLNKIND